MDALCALLDTTPGYPPPSLADHCGMPITDLSLGLDPSAPRRRRARSLAEPDADTEPCIGLSWADGESVTLPAPVPRSTARGRRGRPGSFVPIAAAAVGVLVACAALAQALVAPRVEPREVGSAGRPANAAIDPPRPAAPPPPVAPREAPYRELALLGHAPLELAQADEDELEVLAILAGHVPAIVHVPAGTGSSLEVRATLRPSGAPGPSLDPELVVRGPSDRATGRPIRLVTVPPGADLYVLSRKVLTVQASRRVRRAPRAIDRLLANPY